MPYKTQSPDTTPEFEKVMFDLLREKTPAERFRLAREHIDGCISRARRRIARLHPEWSEGEVAFHWAEQMYGTELMQCVREHLQQCEKKTNG